VEPLTTLIALALASTVTAVHAAEPKVAVFDFEFVDTSVEGATNGPRSDEGARLAWLDREMRQRLAQSGRTDESWSSALDWLVDRYLLAPGAGVF
jgi:hypothetical protein